MFMLMEVEDEAVIKILGLNETLTLIFSPSVYNDYIILHYFYTSLIKDPDF